MAAKNIPSGVVYEPRSLWSCRTVATSGGSITRPVVNFNFNREHFRNGTRWPIEIRRIAVSAINYIWSADAPTAFGRDVTSGIVSRATFRIGVPFRQKYMPQEFSLSNLCPMPTAEPMAREEPSTGLFGQVRLNVDDDKPLIIPRTGTLEMQTTALQDSQTQVPNRGTLCNSDICLDGVPAEFAFHESGGLFGGSARSKRIVLPIVRQPTARLLGGNGQNNDTNDDLPYGIPTGFGPYTDAVTPVQFWPETTKISGGDWNRQEATRSGSTRILASSVAFDQMLYDDVIALSYTGRVAALSQRIGSSVRLLNCGSQAYWWRPGCPLALSHDSITPAIVYQLPQPIVVQPGDAFDVAGTIPAQDYGKNFGLSGSGGAASRYQLGVSFNGYAAIES